MNATSIYNRNDSGGCKSSNDGAVLVMALLIVSLVASLAVSFASAFQLHLARGENRWHGAQARAFLLGAESLAIDILEEDDTSGKIDYLGEAWAQTLEPFPVEGGWLQAELEDAQARFNLNMLTAKVQTTIGESDDARRFTPVQRRFIRLLQTFETAPVSPAQAIAVMEALIDWLDADDEVTGFGGAESLYYSQLARAYRPANSAFTSASELRLVRHVTPELYKALRPYVAALPGTAGLNVNTMSVPLLRILQDDLDLKPLSRQEGEQLALARGETGYESVDKFLTSDSLGALQKKRAKLSEDGLVVASEYFMLHAESSIVRQRRRLTSLLWRHDGQVIPIRRIDP